MWRRASRNCRDPRLKDNDLLRRLLTGAYFLEVGLLLAVIPWSVFWERNYFSESSRIVHVALTNHYVRGAISGLGLVNVAFGLVELAFIIAARRLSASPLNNEGASGEEPLPSR